MRRARREDRPVRERDLVDEITRKPLDPEAASHLSPKELHRVAVHEAGHALAACLASSQGSDLAFISIVPRSDGTLGFVASFPSEPYALRGPSISSVSRSFWRGEPLRC